MRRGHGGRRSLRLCDRRAPDLLLACGLRGRPAAPFALRGLALVGGRAIERDVARQARLDDRRERIRRHVRFRCSRIADRGAEVVRQRGPRLEGARRNRRRDGVHFAQLRRGRRRQAQHLRVARVRRRADPEHDVGEGVARQRVRRRRVREAAAPRRPRAALRDSGAVRRPPVGRERRQRLAQRPQRQLVQLRGGDQ